MPNLSPAVLKFLANPDASPHFIVGNLGNHDDIKKEVALITKALEDNTTVTKFVYHASAMRDDAAKNFSDLLKKNRTIKELHLSSSNMGSKGAKDIADGIKVNDSIITLSLKFQGLKNEGIRYIANALTNNNTITTFNSASSQLSDDQVKLFTDALEQNQHITVFAIDGQQEITNDGLKHISKMLDSNYIITEIKLPIIDRRVVQTDSVLRADPERPRLEPVTASDKIEGKKIRLDINQKLARNRELVKELAGFLLNTKNSEYLKNDDSGADKLKFYQLVNKDLLTKYLQEIKQDTNPQIFFQKINKYINDHYFEITGVSKNLGKENSDMLETSLGDLPLELRSQITKNLKLKDVVGEKINFYDLFNKEDISSLFKLAEKENVSMINASSTSSAAVGKHTSNLVENRKSAQNLKKNQI